MGSVATNEKVMKAYRDYFDQLDIQRDGFDFNESFLELYSDDVLCVWAGDGIVSGPYRGKKEVFESITKTIELLMASTWGVKNVAEYVGEDGFATLEEVTDGEGKIRSYWMFRYEVNDDGLISRVETFLGHGSRGKDDFRAPNIANWY